ncbi:hypothetical protein HK097_009838 [Rhizophlyctis rosea]|uniref:microtubule-severing ATPase n=1 Tax=Rhizophlyctis rosea TaxID=64517 RepID=A0AAD5SIY9_9FUNG|nr:hypothetical protein HK097_009838 [Rhizophlyctis rosea]
MATFPSPSFASSSLSASSALQYHKNLSQQAYKSITAGLDWEQLKGDKVKALECYRRGVRELREALGVQFGSETERQKAASLNTKMRSNLSQIEDRIRIIESSQQPTYRSSSRSSPSQPTFPSSYTSKPLSSSKSAPAVNSATPRLRTNQPARSASVSNGGAKEVKLSGLKNVDPAMANRILNEVVVGGPEVGWDDIVGLEAAKQALREIVVLPTLRPELFTGLRAPARGVLLFGPPGTGKTMLAKAVASESKATFFSISASSLTSKFVGEGEKMVRTLFQMARQLQPAVIFIDEIDSILTERSESEHEASRRLKTEFLLQFDGIGTGSGERILLLGATNRPGELDEAALRRLVKRIYIPLPEPLTREALIRHLLRDHHHVLSNSDVKKIVRLTEGYSASDITSLAREASLYPIRHLGADLLTTPVDQIRAVEVGDFVKAMEVIRRSVSESSVRGFERWNGEYGTGG